MKDNREIKKASSIWRSRSVCVIATTLILWIWGDIAQPQATSCQVGTYDCTGQLYLSNGNVGIGTTTPVQKLEVAGNLAISGSMTSGTVPLARMMQTFYNEQTATKGADASVSMTVVAGDLVEVWAYGAWLTGALGQFEIRVNNSGSATGVWEPQPRNIVYMDGKGGALAVILTPSGVFRVTGSGTLTLTTSRVTPSTLTDSLSRRLRAHRLIS